MNNTIFFKNKRFSKKINITLDNEYSIRQYDEIKLNLNERKNYIQVYNNIMTLIVKNQKELSDKTKELELISTKYSFESIHMSKDVNGSYKLYWTCKFQLNNWKLIKTNLDSDFYSLKDKTFKNIDELKKKLMIHTFSILYNGKIGKKSIKMFNKNIILYELIMRISTFFNKDKKITVKSMIDKFSQMVEKDFIKLKNNFIRKLNNRIRLKNFNKTFNNFYEYIKKDNRLYIKEKKKILSKFKNEIKDILKNLDSNISDNASYIFK